MTIPDSVTSIGSSAFSNTAYYNDENNWENGILYIGKYLIDTKLIYGYNYTIKDGTLVIADSAFSNHSSLTSITIPNSVTSIGNEAFYYCSGLKSLTIPDSVTSIGSEAFLNCSGLTSVTIGNGLKSIGYHAFYGCSKVTSVYYQGNIAGWCTIGGLSETWLHWTLYIGGQALKNITIPDSVSRIESSAFYGCSGLTSVTIPDSVTSIGNSAFRNCSGLTSVTIGNGVKSIEEYAFYNCSNLKSVAIGNGVTSIEQYAFHDTAYYNDESNREDGVLYIGKYLIDAKTTLAGEYTIKEGTLAIATTAFSGCSGLTSISIPDSVTSIGSSAFFGCSGLAGVYITDLAAWCRISFDNHTANPLYYAKNLYLNGTLVEGELVIPDSVTSIGSYAFFGCSGMTGITIPDSVTNIGRYAFSSCNGLTSVTFRNTTGWWRSSDSTATSGTSISSSDLSSPSTAAKYLTSTYYRYYWKRG